MKQTTFADAIGLTLKQAGEIERGNSFPKPEKLEIIARALNVPLKELFDFGKTRYFPNPPVMPTTEVRRAPRKSRNSQAS
jgi:transcriptional regulator with XRE-family HTH domain